MPNLRNTAKSQSVWVAVLCLLVAFLVTGCTAVGREVVPPAARSESALTTAADAPDPPADRETAPAAAAEPAPTPPDPEPKPAKPASAVVKLKAAEVIRVVDGDTAHVRMKDTGDTEKVRFIGVDTPESTIEVEPYGYEASAYTKKHLSGKSVYLETDAEKRDRYGRLLAYVWMSKPVEADQDGRPTFGEARKRMFNAWLARDGYAQILTIPPNVKYEDYFLQLQRSARDADKGLWDPSLIANSEPSKPDGGSFIGNRNSMKFHESSCRWVSAMSESNKVQLSSRAAALKAGYVPCKVCRP